MMQATTCRKILKTAAAEHGPLSFDKIKTFTERLKSEVKSIKRSVEVCRIRKHGTLVCAV